ncbi:hypothetical protein HPB50_016184 [Hyalomma asiaticum]|uniref:Uncharacterized protein n=1 Tax=Hyalomma asiaticum TaxID=266040 RepID=A0ACB7TLB6_HYAAI|nr:hypothetical protein HPB50_016184 [Hyalomma asiaticum]
MEKLKAKRRTLRRQSTIIIKEATTALEGANTVQLSALLQRLDVINSKLRKVNTELEKCRRDDIFLDDYAESVQYDDRVNNTIGLLRAKIISLRSRQLVRRATGKQRSQLRKGKPR